MVLEINLKLKLNFQHLTQIPLDNDLPEVFLEVLEVKLVEVFLEVNLVVVLLETNLIDLKGEVSLVNPIKISLQITHLLKILIKVKSSMKI